jgi:TRAP-type mannitol/chloroaromatic compound transport system permease small subunit
MAPGIDEPPAKLLRVLAGLDTINEWFGRAVAFMVLPLMMGLSYEVIMRYGFDAPTFWAYDTSYMLYGSHFMLGAGYTLLKKGHIRTDFFYENWSVRQQATVDATCYLFLFFPGMILFLIAGWQSAHLAWVIRETSEATAWRPYIYPFKWTIPIGAIFLILQGVSEFLKSLYAARTGRRL